jgi:two-component system, OmpR family, sensor histidine kinase KdpD
MRLDWRHSICLVIGHPLFNASKGLLLLRNSQRKGRLPWLATKLRFVNFYLGSAITVALFLGFALAMPERAKPWSAGVILVMAVLATASVWGLRQGLFASLLTVAAYDFFFFPPLYSLTIDDWQHVLALLIFAIATGVVSLLAEGLNGRAVEARQNEIIAKRLNAFGQSLRDAQDIATVANETVSTVGVALGAKAMLLMPKAGVLRAVAAHPRGARLNHMEVEEIECAYEQGLRRTGEAAGNAALTCTLLPVDNFIENAAVLVVCETRRRFWQLPNRTRLIDMFARPASGALKRIALSKQAEEARIAAETEKLRSALLTSISHDLKAPLAIILGSASSLKDLHCSLSEKAAMELVDSVLEEGERLNQFIANLLDMSRIESKAITPKRQPCDLNDIAGSALQRAKRALSRHRVEVHVSDQVPFLELDAVLLETVFFNILENAAHYTPAGTQVALTARNEGDWAVIRVLDEGPGVPPEELPQLFHKFYRGSGGEWKPKGTGLGLAIARGFVQAMGGTISAANRKDRIGAVFTIKFPVARLRAAQPFSSALTEALPN